MTSLPHKDEGTRDDGMRFTVLGQPKPAGSKRAFVNPKTGKAIVVDSSGAKGKDWRTLVRDAGAEAMDGRTPLSLPLQVTMVFFQPRPKSHYGTGKNAAILKPGAPPRPTTRPDALKLARAVEDALTGIIWRDDSEIVDERLVKLYGSPARVVCEVELASTTTEEDSDG